MLDRLFLLFLFAISGVANAASYRADLNQWIAEELTPYITGQLTTQPRFKNESVRFVVFSGDDLQSASNKLALGIRDQLRDAMAGEKDLNILWLQEAGQSTDNTRIDCTRDSAAYYIGIDVFEAGDGLLSVNVKALDVVDGSWVAGFSRSWKGYPNANQRRSFDRYASDPTFRGMRGAPFDESQLDLLAAFLARDLGCALLSQTNGEYVVFEGSDGGNTGEEGAMIELVGNNLADYKAIQFSTDVDDANAMIEGNAHRIDANLYQYWITITPNSKNSDLSTLSASAYIRIEDKFARAELLPAVTVAVSRAQPAFLGEFRVVELRNTGECTALGLNRSNRQIFGSPYSSAAVDCFALEVETSVDAVLFFLNHQLNNGLVRLSGENCSSRSDARIARNSNLLRFPLPVDSLMSAQWTGADDWQMNPDKDTYYVIAANDTRAARALANHIQELPNRCTASVRRGFDSDKLEFWMDELVSITTHFEKSVDWQVIRVKNMY